MKLLIHDLNKEDWEKRAEEYEGWTIISDNGSILPCVGCFGCWNRTPGSCVMKDGYGNMGYLIHHADEVRVISRYTYGGFSGFVKNVFDRSLAYVLPHFEIVNGESHHRKRYDEEKPYTFIFYGPRLSEEEKESARRYVKAVATNMRTLVKNVIFEENEEVPAIKEAKKPQETGDVILLNCSMRKGNSLALAEQLAKRLKEKPLLLNLSEYLKDHDRLLETIKDARALVFCTPLYVDGLPSQLIRLLEYLEKQEWENAKKIYAIANMGLYENSQLVNLFEALRQWCRNTGFTYCGSLGVAAGELVGGLMQVLPFEKGFTAKIAQEEDRLAEAIDEGNAIEDIYSGPGHFPRWLYIAIANGGWSRMARANGISEKDLYRQL